MSNFNKGELTSEAYNVIMRDIQLLKDCRKDKEDFDYHYDLVVNNLKDIFGLNDYEMMSYDELTDEWEALNEIINEVGCYGVKDCMKFRAIECEMLERGIL